MQARNKPPAAMQSVDEKSVNFRDEIGRTPLFSAPSATAVSELLTAGCVINAEDKYGCTALHVAVVNGKHDVVTALLAAGASPLAMDHCGNNVLHRASTYTYSLREVCERTW